MIPITIVTKKITIASPVAKVWEVITNPLFVKQWISDAGMSVSSDWNVGSEILFEGTLNNVHHRDKGIILELEKEKVFRYSYWSKITRLPDKPENYAIIEFILSQEDGKVKLTITNSNLIAKASYEHSNFYWSITLQVIKKLAEAE